MSEMDKINGANWMSGLCSDLPITAINTVSYTHLTLPTILLV